MPTSLTYGAKQFLSQNRQFLTFLAVGAVNTLFGYSLFVIFLLLGCHYTLAVFLSTCLGILFNFKTIGSIVFKNNDKRLLVNFLMVYGFLYALNIALISVLQLGIANLYIAGGIATILIAGLSFFLNKQFVFNKTVKDLSLEN
jgi:putative flippase GtrA